ncbi:MAG: YtxH domain-containing protein [Gammaproteobacteria bacterium]|jgi:gas vesicle protein|nr:YtxH domain-containing protein [Gammaproteobacteria bacterium]MBT4130327.1 YtxH domain-containing protein [Candidatus Neomarinimicrobiota bacterium]MBT4329560.1 YtxH domain-containing protein [Gammaproteobacteria bacterium]MBT4606970.1 YtxH domain-containing protein [Thiotrichales bacterium]
MSVADDLIQQLNTLLSVWGSIYHLTFWFQPDQYPEARIFATLTYESTDEKPDMNQDRRDFFRNIGTKTVVAATSVVAPAALHAEALAEQIKQSSKEISDNLSKTAEDINERLTDVVSEASEQIRDVTDRIDTAALVAGYQQIQINLLFMLIALSFAVDGGMTLFWALYTPPMLLP